ncbi:metallophosphoesterase [Candidatus Woesearchaeota archaeon]|nr:metallophosphoesterase [Candidatus Woesearchaeota archaeon]
MKIFGNISLIDLAIYTHNHLIVTDFHIGYEEALNKQGLLVPRFQFEEIIKRMESLFSELKGKKIERIIINGDLKHEFGAISQQEWRHTLKLLDYLGKHCSEIILIKGNHDTILGAIAKKRNIKVLEHYIVKNRILVMHGNLTPPKELLKDISTIIIGHDHPAVLIREGVRAELFKAYLTGKWKGKNLIAQPSFNLVTEGTDVLKEEVLSPFLKDNLSNFEAIIVADKLYNFGSLKNLL